MKFLPHTTGTNKLMAMYEMVKTHIEQYAQTRTRYCRIAKGTTEEGPISGNAGEADVNVCRSIRRESEEDITRRV